MKKSTALAVVCSLILLGGCANKTTAPTAASSVSLNRSVPERLTDIGIKRQILSHLDGIEGLSQGNHRVAIDSFRGNVLLTGEAPSEQTAQAIANMAQSIAEVKRVHNRLSVGEAKSQSHSVHENYLKTKLNGKILVNKIRPSQYHLVVRDDTAYVMGALTYAQRNLIEKLAQETQGILGLVFLVDILVTQSESDSATNATPYSYSPQSGGAPQSDRPQTSGAYGNTTQSGYIRLYQGTDSP